MIEKWYTFKHRIFPSFIAKIGKSLLTLIAFTCTFRIQGKEHLEKTANKGSAILSVWHNRLPMVIEILLRSAPQFSYAAVISDSRDGQIIASIANSYPQASTIRVPSRSRGVALKTIISHLKKEKSIIVITPDGPRGPAYKAKPGLSLAAQESCSPVIAMHWNVDRCWVLKTWDSMIIPKPFSTITVEFSSPLHLETGRSHQENEKIVADFLQLTR